MDPENLEPWLALSLLPGVGPVLAQRALERFGDPGEAAFRAPLDAWCSIPGFRLALKDEFAAARASLGRSVRSELKRARSGSVAIVPYGAPDYPSALIELPDAPLVLYLRGEIPGGVTRIAVVGSRRASAYGRRIAGGLGATLAERGVEIVSGGARGIDACSHRGALDAGGRTIIVLGSGLSRPYPPEHTKLFDEAAARGAVVSEFPMEMEPLGENFPRRNRLISGLSAAVVVVEATTRSGSLGTAARALEQGREVMAVPGPVTSEQSAGCHRLIQQGAKLVQCSEDVLVELSPMYTASLSGAPGRPAPFRREDLSPDEAAVLALFDDPEPVHVDRLADAAPFGIARLQAALVGLVVRGAVEQLTGGYYLPGPSSAQTRGS